MAGFAEVRRPADVGIGTAWVHVAVNAAHRSRGYGSALLHRAETWTVRQRAERLLGALPDSLASGRQLAAHRGYREIHHTVDCVADLADAPSNLWPDVPRRLCRGGFRWRLLADYEPPGRRPELLTLLAEAEADTPDSGSFSRVPPEEWWGSLFDGPAVWPETGVVIQAADGSAVAFSAYCRLSGRPDQATVEFTGASRLFRGHGLVLAVKVAALTRLRAAGAVSVNTSNHVGNGAILAINRRLGYRPLFGHIVVEKIVTGETPAGTV